jgi:hypothetical protein
LSESLLYGVTARKRFCSSTCFQRASTFRRCFVACMSSKAIQLLMYWRQNTGKQTCTSVSVSCVRPAVALITFFTTQHTIACGTLPCSTPNQQRALAALNSKLAPVTTTMTLHLAIRRIHAHSRLDCVSHRSFGCSP